MAILSKKQMQTIAFLHPLHLINAATETDTVLLTVSQMDQYNKINETYYSID